MESRQRYTGVVSRSPFYPDVWAFMASEGHKYREPNEATQAYLDYKIRTLSEHEAYEEMRRANQEFDTAMKLKPESLPVHSFPKTQKARTKASHAKWVYDKIHKIAEPKKYTRADAEEFLRVEKAMRNEGRPRVLPITMSDISTPVFDKCFNARSPMPIDEALSELEMKYPHCAMKIYGDIFSALQKDAMNHGMQGVGEGTGMDLSWKQQAFSEAEIRCQIKNKGYIFLRPTGIRNRHPVGAGF